MFGKGRFGLLLFCGCHDDVKFYMCCDTARTCVEILNRVMPNKKLRGVFFYCQLSRDVLGEAAIILLSMISLSCVGVVGRIMMCIDERAV